MRRGRPRHDDVLTPREWEVLDLLRRGLTNAEIADRLGVTRDTAKFHVSEIISKLGVDNREQAASWGGRPRVTFGLAPLAGLVQKAAAVSPWKLAAGSTVAMAGAGLAALLIGVLLSSSTQSAGVPVDTVTVRWIEEDPPPPVSWEAPHPFADLVPPGTQDVWRAYVVEGNGAPRLLTETNRYLQDIFWSGDDGVTIRYTTRQRDSEGVLGPVISGALGLNTRTGSTSWDRINDHIRMSPAPFDGRLMLMTFPSQLYVTEPGVSSFRLEGIAVWLASFWSPDGGYFIAIGEEGDARSGPSGHAYVYLLTPGENTAIKLDTKTATGGYALPRPSPDGALVMYSEGDRLAIVDVKARTIRRLPLSLGGLASTSIPIWSDDGRYISYGEAVIDVQNGTFVRAPSSGGGEVSSRVSPDGTWLVASSPSYIDEGEQPDCPLIEPTFAANRTRIISLRDNSERSVLVCEDMAFSPWQWLDDSHVLMTGSSCRTCREKRLEWLLLDVRNGSAQTLAVDSRGGFAFDTQEDGSVIVGGNITSEPFGALHIYEAIGRPIRHIDSPDGAPVRTVAWSPDGDAFVFVTGPEADLSQFYRSGP